MEQSLSQSSGQHEDILAGIQANLSTVRDRLIHKKIECDSLAEENAQLKQVVERLLEMLESRSKDAVHDKLQDLDIQLNVLLELSQEEVAGPLADPPEVSTEPSGAESAQLNEPAADAAAAVTDDGAGAPLQRPSEPSSTKPSLLEEIQSRVRRLTEQLGEDALQALAAPRPPEVQFPESESSPDQSTDGAATAMIPPLGDDNPAGDKPERDTAEQAAPQADPVAARAPAVNTAARSPNASRRDLGAAGRRSDASTSRRAAYSKPRGHLDAEVEYALSILHRLKQGGQSFSVEEVRDLINGKFNLALTDKHDKEIVVSLSNQLYVRPSARKKATWMFGAAG